MSVAPGGRLQSAPGCAAGPGRLAGCGGRSEKAMGGGSAGPPSDADQGKVQ